MRTRWVACVGLIACAVASCGSGLPDFTAKPANPTAESIERASEAPSTTTSTTTVPATIPPPTAPTPTAAPTTVPSGSSTSNAMAFCAAWVGIPIDAGGMGAMTGIQVASKLQAATALLKSKVRPVTPPELVGDLDRYVADVNSLAEGLQRAGAGPAASSFRNFTSDEIAASNRVVAMLGKEGAPDGSGNVTVTYPNALAAWVAAPCGPKPLQQTVKGTFQPVGGSLD